MFAFWKHFTIKTGVNIRNDIPLHMIRICGILGLSGIIAAAAAKSLQSSPTLRPIDGSPSGSPVPGILKIRTLEWVAISFSNA